MNIVEFCDGTDNDCDGAIDEGLNYNGQDLGAFCTGVGACGPGVVTCNDQGLATCSTNPDGPFSQASAELCDGIDNDCNGATDESHSVGGVFVGYPCDGVGACGAGVAECLDLTTAVCSTSPGGSASEAVVEVCDGVDNDCDGHVDEELTLNDSPCQAVGVCETGGVIAKCKLAQWECTYEAVEGYETEEVSATGSTTTVMARPMRASRSANPVMAPTRTSAMVFQCNDDADVVTCGTESDPNKIESCNGVDDDCDGITDETNTSSGAAGCSLTGVVTPSTRSWCSATVTASCATTRASRLRGHRDPV